MESEQDNAMLMAVKGDRLADVLRILREGTVEVDAVDTSEHGCTALVCAAHLGHVGITRVLIEKGKASIDVADKNNQISLILQQLKAILRS